MILILSRFEMFIPNHQPGIKRWSWFPGQPAKVGSPMKRMIHHEDTQTVHG